MKTIFFLICLSFISLAAWPQWNPTNAGDSENLVSVHFPSGDTGYAVSYRYIGSALYYSRLYRTNDAGTTWSFLQLPDGKYSSVFFTDGHTGYLTGLGTIHKTNDAGMNWTVYSTGTQYRLMSVFFTDGDHGYVCGGDLSHSVILKTADAGVSWDSLTIGDHWELNSVFFSDLNTGYAAGYNHIYKTTDAGNTWSLIYTGGNSGLNSINFPKADIGICAGNVGTILRTTDYGNTWESIQGGTDLDLHSVCFPVSDIGYIAGNHGTILKSVDGGLSWLAQPSGSDKCLNSVYFTDSNTGFSVGDSGIILKTENGGGVPYNVEDQKVNIYIIVKPDPERGKIVITTPGIAAKSDITLFDLRGVEILNAGFKNQDCFELDVRSLPKGFYLIRIRSDQLVNSTKVLIN